LGVFLTLPRGELEGALTIEMDLSTNAVLEPTSIAPDLWYGVTDRFTIGVIHSANALSLVEAGDGVCLGGIDHGCARTYSNLGLDARYAIVPDLAAHVRLVTRRWDPWLPSVRIGALGRYARGRFAITADPYLQLGLANTDRGNRARVNVPLWLSFDASERVSVYARTGVDGELAVFGDAWGVPIALGARVSITPAIDLAAEAGFERAAGPLNESKLRECWLSIEARGVRFGP